MPWKTTLDFQISRRIKEWNRKDTPEYCGREEWTKQAKGIKRVFRQSRIRDRRLWWRIGKETSGEDSGLWWNA